MFSSPEQLGVTPGKFGASVIYAEYVDFEVTHIVLTGQLDGAQFERLSELSTLQTGLSTYVGSTHRPLSLGALREIPSH